MSLKRVILLGLLCACNGPPRETGRSAQLCDSARVTGRLPAEITEASGVVASRRTPGIFWVHNDSRTPVLFAIDSSGALKGRVQVAGATNVDWEDIAAAPCGAVDCLFIGDIGDNLQARDDRVIYRVREPLPTDSLTERAVRYPVRMPGKSEDAEALVVTPQGRMYIITKGRSGPITMFAFPPDVRPETAAALRPLHTLSSGLVQLPDMVTAASSSPDGRFLIIRTYSAFQLFQLDEDGLHALADSRFDLQPLAEPQGEGIDMTADGSVWLVSERGFEAGPPPIARVRCHLPAAN